ncbi:PAP2 superfamily-domain-containing protein [Cantharellus anzutake]|uniref:PAP2 superfamily-domain-containing protein n=1 Tax=Cantharellus anzutake TaxID=1750568 RepID=UPI0019077BD3|nr:PAP2 superfamily-domain-containing protein [Cantharellus anzutake]KAF8340502.1 PAP2 superfamily-domain-containing protein [Cantharellus anzutake]
MSDLTAELSAFSLTHVVYDASSRGAALAAFITLVPIYLTPAYLSIIVCTRELTVISMFVGQCICDGLNVIIKHLVKQERPGSLLGEGYGFPSQHSQYMGYFSTFLLLHLAFKHSFVSRGLVPERLAASLSMLLKLTVSVAIWLLAVGVCYSRYFLSYHSPAQVAAGYLFGVIWALIYYFLVESSNPRTAALRRAFWTLFLHGWGGLEMVGLFILMGGRRRNTSSGGHYGRLPKVTAKKWNDGC